MVTVLRIDGLRVVIFLNDHEPAHVHGLGADGQAKINLAGQKGGPELVWAENLSRAEIRRAMSVIVKQRQRLLEHWRTIHG